MTSKNRAGTQHTGSKADRIIDMMRDGVADGGTAAELAALLGDTDSKMISAILRYALRRGVVEVVFDDGRCTYHLVRGWTTTTTFRCAGSIPVLRRCGLSSDCQQRL